MTRRASWVRRRLEEWGQWVTQRCTGGLGWPKRSILAGDGGGAACTDNIPLSPLACEQTDRAVREVASRDLGLWLVLMCRYAGDPHDRPARRRPMSAAEISRCLCVSEVTVNDRLKRAERLVDEGLTREQGVAAG